jgi:hypothetical protein
VRQQAAQQQLLQRPPTIKRWLPGAATQRADLLQVAMASQQAQCVRLVVDALLQGRFSKVSVVLHMYESLQALIHDPQVRQGHSVGMHDPPQMSAALHVDMEGCCVSAFCLILAHGPSAGASEAELSRDEHRSHRWW